MPVRAQLWRQLWFLLLSCITYLPLLAKSAPVEEVSKGIIEQLEQYHIPDTLESYCLDADSDTHKKWYAKGSTTLNATDCWTALQHYFNEPSIKDYPNRNLGYDNIHSNAVATEKLPREWAGDAKQCIFAMVMRESQRYSDIREILDAYPKGAEIVDEAMGSVLDDQAATLWDNCPWGGYNTLGSRHGRAGYKIVGTKSSMAMLFYEKGSRLDNDIVWEEKATLVFKPGPGSVS